MDWLAALWRRLVGGRPADRQDPLAGLEPGATRLIVGLGNPGEKYAATRHNVGFMAVDQVARQAQATWHDRSPDLQALVAVVPATVDQPPLVLAKPQTFMNRSGEAVSALMRALAVQPEQVLVVYDDMDLPFGALRLRERGSPGTHNGMRSVASETATDAIPRLRMGISQAATGAAIDHVLGTFAASEHNSASELIGRAAAAARTWAKDGAPTAMNRYNKG